MVDLGRCQTAFPARRVEHDQFVIRPSRANGAPGRRQLVRIPEEPALVRVTGGHLPPAGRFRVARRADRATCRGSALPPMARRPARVQPTPCGLPQRHPPLLSQTSTLTLRYAYDVPLADQLTGRGHRACLGRDPRVRSGRPGRLGRGHPGRRRRGQDLLPAGVHQPEQARLHAARLPRRVRGRP